MMLNVVEARHVVMAGNGRGNVGIAGGETAAAAAVSSALG